MNYRILDMDSVASFVRCANWGDGKDHGNFGSYAVVDGRSLCYACAAPLIYTNRPDADIVAWDADIADDIACADAYRADAFAKAVADAVYIGTRLDGACYYDYLDYTLTAPFPMTSSDVGSALHDMTNWNVVAGLGAAGGYCTWDGFPKDNGDGTFLITRVYHHGD